MELYINSYDVETFVKTGIDCPEIWGVVLKNPSAPFTKNALKLFRFLKLSKSLIFSVTRAFAGSFCEYVFNP